MSLHLAYGTLVIEEKKIVGTMKIIRAVKKEKEESQACMHLKVSPPGLLSFRKSH